jgi:hypothetical protein
MQEKNIPTGYLKAWYNFESGASTGSAGLIYNQVYSVSDHYYDTANDDGDLKSGIMAGMSIGDHDVISTPGLFDYREMVEISEDVLSNNWTIFLDIDSKRPGLSLANQQNMTGKLKILLSSMKTSEDTSGFYIGLNGHNKPFVTYSSNDGKQYTHTFSEEPSNRNLLSFSFNSDGKNLNIHKHSPKEDYSESFVTNVMSPSYNWTLGGFKEYLNNSAPTTDIRAFDGTVNHFMLFSPALKGEKEKEFADFLFINNYEKPDIKERLVSSTVNSTGAYIAQGVVGQGVVGYQKEFSHTMNGIDIYKTSEVLGDIYGDVITYSSTSDPVYSYESYFTEESKGFDSAKCLNFFDKKIQFIKNKDNFSLPAGGSLYHDSTRHLISKTSDDKYEIRASTNANRDLNKTASWNGLSGSFILQSGIDFKYINLYRNGLLQRSGTLAEVNSTDTDGTGFADYTVLDSRFVYSNDRYYKDDFITYEECDVENIIGGFDAGEDADYMYNGNKGSYFMIEAPIYLNGKDMFFGGTKLIYGIDYVYFSSTVASVYTAGLDKGVFSWVQSFDTNSTYNVAGNSENGNFKYHIETNKNLMDEILWVSGVRQRRGVDYIKTPDFSVLNNARINRNTEGGENYQGEWGGDLVGSIPEGAGTQTYNPFDKSKENANIIYGGNTGFFNS